MFGDAMQHGHMMMGVRKAIASPRTPPHLKKHLKKRITGGSPMTWPGKMRGSNGGPAGVGPNPDLEDELGGAGNSNDTKPVLQQIPGPAGLKSFSTDNVNGEGTRVPAAPKMKAPARRVAGMLGGKVRRPGQIDKSLFMGRK